MANNKENISNIAAFTSAFLGNLEPREREVLRARYGLDGGAPQTLQAIGNRYKITRERVRQIENAALIALRKERHPYADTLVKAAVGELDRTGGAAHEEEFMENLKRSLKDSGPLAVFANTAKFLLELSGKASPHRDPYGAWHPFWYVSGDARKRVQQFVTRLVGTLEERKNEVLSDKKFDTVAKEVAADLRIPEHHAKNYMKLSKRFVTSPFNEVGLADWAEVNPRTARDWAYVVLKRGDRPMHFSEIATLVGKHRKQKYTNLQTVHNELIKDDRFVLVGRGLYGLRESGLLPGTAREIIAHVLKQEGPLQAEEIVSKVREQRVLKEGTILINLQNKKHFTSLPDGRYFVREA